MNVLAGCAAAAGLLLTANHALAQDISGRWSGFGQAKIASNGKLESFRCRVAYDRQTSRVFSVRAVCANPSVRIIQTGTVLKVRQNTFIGDLYSQEFDVRGRVRVVVTGSRQTVTVRASSGSGLIKLKRR